MRSPELISAARRVRLVVLDVDGVLTDGRIWFVPAGFGSSGFVEVKAFDAADGAGIAAARRAGLAVAIVSGRASPVVDLRAGELRIDDVRQGVLDKVPAVEEIMASRGIGPEETAFVGDDIVDLPVMARVGFPVAVANASDDVKPHAAYVTRSSGGRGAVREVCELILKAQGKWGQILDGLVPGS